MLPHSRCNYITSDKQIMLGCMPQNKIDFDNIIQLGIDVFVNLTVDPASYLLYMEDENGRQYRHVMCIHFPIKSGRVSGVKQITTLCNFLLQLYEDGKKLYIHCAGGHGRAGTIGAILLGHIEELDAAEAIKKIESYRETRLDTSKNYIPTPETNEQIFIIQKILGLKEGHVLPDRSNKNWLKRVKIERLQRKN